MYRQKLMAVLFIILSLLMMGAAPPQPIGATQNRVISLADLGYKTDETLIGIRADRIYGVNWPQGWKPEKGNALKLSFSHSPALKSSSSVVVDWNGTRLGSTLLTTSNADQGTLDVEIPENLIVPGYNALRLEFYMGIHDDFCEDLVNPAIWATIHSDSTLTLSYSALAPALNLGTFPYPLIDPSDLVTSQVTFVVPDQPNAAELNAIAIISARLGKEASYRVLTLDAVSAAGVGTLTGNLVYIGLADRLPALPSGSWPFISTQSAKARLVDQGSNLIPDSAGLLWEQASPNDPTSVALAVTGENEVGLLKAAAALGSEKAYSQLGGQLGVILDVPKPEVGQAPYDRVMTLQDLGYADVVARGFRNQTINFNIPLPLAWQVNSEIPFEIHFAHSTLLDARQSAMNISLNGTPVSNIVLNNDNAQDAWATVKLPARLFKVGNNKLTIQSTVNLIEGYINAAQCGKNYEDEAWVSVFSDSRLHLPDAPAGLAISLLDYPYAYMGDPSLAQLALIVPDNSDLTIAKAVTQIASRLGRYADGTALYPVVQTASTALATTPPYPYQILIGLATDNSAIQQLNDTLPLPFQAGTNLLQANKKLPQVVVNNRGYLQVVQTKDGYPRLVVSGMGKDSLLWAVNAISNPVMMVNLKGDAALLDGQEAIVTLQVKEPPKVETTPATATVNGVQVTQPTIWVWWVAGGFAVLAILVFLILGIAELIRRRQEKKSYEAH